MTRAKMVQIVLWLNLAFLLCAWISTFRDPGHYYSIYTALVFYVFAFAIIVVTFCLTHRKNTLSLPVYRLAILSAVVSMAYVIIRITKIG